MSKTREDRHERKGFRRAARARPRKLRKLLQEMAARRCGAPEIFLLEQEFWRESVANEDVFLQAAAALNLQFVAFDFSSLADGGVMLWEANPYPNIRPLASGAMAQPRQLSARATMHLEAFTDFFRKLLERPALPARPFAGSTQIRIIAAPQ